MIKNQRQKKGYAQARYTVKKVGKFTQIKDVKLHK